MNMETKIKLEPLFARVIVEYYNQNPHRKQQTKSGIFLPPTGLSLIDKEQDGIVAGGEQRIAYGIIREVANDCKHLKAGDEVIFDLFQGMPLAIDETQLKLIPETAVLSIIRKEF